MIVTGDQSAGDGFWFDDGRPYPGSESGPLGSLGIRRHGHQCGTSRGVRCQRERQKDVR